MNVMSTIYCNLCLYMLGQLRGLIDKFFEYKILDFYTLSSLVYCAHKPYEANISTQI